MKGLASQFRSFVRSRAGNFALSAAFAAPVLLGLVGGATDLVIFQSHRAELQSAADAAVLAAASEANLKGWTEETAKQVVAAVVESNLKASFTSAVFAKDVSVDTVKRSVELTLTQDHYGYFLLGYFTGSPQIIVRATARTSGQATLCLIVRAPNMDNAFEVSGKSSISAAGCSAYSNSVKSKGLVARDSSRLTTQLACTAGGYEGKSTNFFPMPITDCPPINDPLAARADVIDQVVSKSGCDFSKMEIKATTRTLQPGTYCGDFKMTDKADVRLQPGIYVFKDTQMVLDSDAKLSGTGVGLVFIGEKSKIEFKHKSSLSLAAPADGPMAGILFYVQPWQNKMRDFKFESMHAEQLLGTVYMPKDRLIVGTVDDPNCGASCPSDVGTASDWTAVVAYTLRITDGVDLVLNSDYAASDIPVPDGLGPHSSKVMLAR